MADALSIADLEGVLRMAQTRFDEASSNANRARRDETVAATALNSAQRAFDKAVATLRLSATGGDWKTERDRRHWTKGEAAE